MKKYSFVFIFLLFVSSMFYSQNNQKIWSVDSEVYTYMTYLYVNEGRALPSSTGPWSTQELKNMLGVFCEKNKIDGDRPLESAEVKNGGGSPLLKNKNSYILYDKIYEILNKPSRFSTKDNFNFSLNGSLNPEFFFHTNSQDFTQESDWYYDFEKRNRLLLLEAEGFAGNYIYGYSNLSLGYTSGTGNSDLETQIYGSNFMSNIPYLPLQAISCIDLNFPFRSFMSAGSEHWSLSAGRDVIRWGNGESGNLLLGGNALYDNNLRMSIFYNQFKWSFVSIFYPHSQDLTNSDQNDSVEGIKMFMAHRFDFRFFKDRINLSIAEAMLYQNLDGILDLRFYNPLGLWHNYYIRGNSNSILDFTIDYTIIDGLNLYGEWIIDEMVGPGEPKGKNGEGWRPGKSGYLLGVKYINPLKTGVFKISIEGVYTDPCLYLREAYDSSTGTQGLSFYGHVREFDNNTGINYIKNCIGYVYGGDCIVGNLKATYQSWKKWSSTAEIFYMAHGIMVNELNYDWSVKEPVLAPSTQDPTINPSNEDGEVESILRLSLSGDYQILKNLNIYGGLDNYFIWNKDNVETSMLYDFQLYSGVVFTF
ncbi:MAG: hypothetical protein K5866_08665 [Treponema sp.]|nr:hypothetical protein [Treponema sp.]